MHELSIVQSLLDLCEKNAKENNSVEITKVEIKIGKLSGIEPHFLKTTFDTFKEKTVCDKAELVMNIQPVVIKCVDCNEENILEDNNFICPKCEGCNIKVIDGEDMMLMRLEMNE